MITQGLRLMNRYVLDERIASGGMGEVWSGDDEAMARRVAVKILRPALSSDRAFQARFREEARTAGGLHHSGIAEVFDYGESDRLYFLVMELVEGEPLSAMLHRCGALPVATTLSLMSQTGFALQAAHSNGVVHRDVKPANLMVTPHLEIKVTDFGIARPRDHEPLTATGQVMGTAHYLAPELARGETANPLSDVYALGIVTYECLAGRRPFEGDNQILVATAQLTEDPPPLPSTIPEPVRAVVERTLSKDPALRPQSAKEFARLLEDLANGVQSPPTAPTVPVEFPSVAPAPAMSLAQATRAEALGRPARRSRTAEIPVSDDNSRLPSRRVVIGLVAALALTVAGAWYSLSSADGDTGSGTPGQNSAGVMPPIALPVTTAEASPDSGNTLATTSVSPSPTPTTVVIDAGTYVGRPFSQVRAELENKSLIVKPRYVPGPGNQRGLVLDVSPKGKLKKGQEVVVRVGAKRGRA